MMSLKTRALVRFRFRRAHAYMPYEKARRMGRKTYHIIEIPVQNMISFITFGNPEKVPFVMQVWGSNTIGDHDMETYLASIKK